jgi:hypothetical protein
MLRFGGLPPEVRRRLRWFRVPWAIGFLMFVAGIVVSMHAASQAPSLTDTCTSGFCGAAQTGIYLCIAGFALEFVSVLLGSVFARRAMGTEAYRQMMASRRMGRRRGLGAMGPMNPMGPMGPLGGNGDQPYLDPTFGAGTPMVPPHPHTGAPPPPVPPTPPPPAPPVGHHG